MVKECIVKINNEDVTVVSYDGIDVQLPSIHREAKTLFLNCENGKYTIVDENTEQTEDVDKKNIKKKTTNDTFENKLNITENHT